MEKWFLRVNNYEGSHLIKNVRVPFCQGDNSFELENCRWHCQVQKLTAQAHEGVEYQIKFTLLEGETENTSVGIDIEFDDWFEENYVLMPAAVYRGNRFEARKIPYSPKLTDPSDIGKDKPIIITDVPRLNIHKGPSAIGQLTGDLSTPAIGFYSHVAKNTFWLLTDQTTHFGNTGLFISESLDRKQAVISLMAPGVREETRYAGCNNSHPSKDKGAAFKAGEEITLRFRIYNDHADCLQRLFDRFVEIRKDLTGIGELIHGLPFASGWSIQEDKYNRQNWEEELGYYAVGLRESIFQDWQIGWTGGMISTYPLLFEGSDLTRKRVLRTFDFLFPNGVAPSGFFWDCARHGKWYGGDIRKPHAEKWHLVRKSGDAIYFILKQFTLMELQKDSLKLPGGNIPSVWTVGLKGVIETFVKLWDQNGQLGQFVDSITGEITVGGSTSGAIVPAGLALASKYYNNPDYLRAAIEIARYYDEHFVKQGITCGGPGDALQNPDSESSFALLNSFVELYEVTQEEEWKQRAVNMAHQYATWVVSYDYQFPSNSLFGKLDMHTLGSVYANTQNKHSAPGICTDSGLALFKLYRATGNLFYLELLRETAHNLTQYLSREDRPISKLEPGWINERVNMSDWAEPVGDIFIGSTWAEVSNMLTFVEIPGLYVQPDKGFVYAFDHIETEVLKHVPEHLTIQIKNPTDFPAKIKLFIEKSSEMNKPLGHNYLYGARQIELAPRGGVANLHISF